MKKILFNFIIFILSTLMLYSGCKDSVTGEDLDNRVIPNSNVSFRDHIQPVFELKCASSNCHNSATRAGGLSLSTYVDATADPTIIFPGEPNSSRLVWTIDPQFSSTTPMPPIGYPPLTINQINGIKKWIEEGAENN